MSATFLPTALTSMAPTTAPATTTLLATDSFAVRSSNNCLTHRCLSVTHKEKSVYSVTPYVDKVSFITLLPPPYS